MNPRHSDALTQTLAQLRHRRPSRRAVLPILGGLLATSLGPSPEIARRRKGDRKRK